MRRAWMMALIVPAMCVVAFGATTRPNPAFARVVDDPKLPRVLLIGDSISIGYTLDVRELMRGKANIHRPATNCGDTARGLKELSKWVGEKKWDVIHFNLGLHDLKYVDGAGNLSSAEKGGTQVASTERYEKNLRALVTELKRTGAKLIFATTTPLPEASSGRVPGDEVKYNEVAKKVMTEMGVEINDLHALVRQHPEIIQRGNVHYAKAGYRMLAEQVSRELEKALK